MFSLYEDCVIGDNVKMGVGEDVINEDKPKIYNTGITVVGEKTVIPANVEIGKNCVIFGETTEADYAEGKLPSGKSAVKEGVE